MKRIFIILLVMLLSVPVFSADKTVSTVFKDAHQTRAFEALSNQTNKQIQITFEYLPKTVEESNTEFAERVQKKMWKAFVEQYEDSVKLDEYNSDTKSAVEAISLPTKSDASNVFE